MEMLVFIGAQAAGKSSFYKSRFFDSHVRINLDMLRTRNRERILIEACLNAQQPFVIDNTNASREQRSKYFDMVRDHKILISGFYFESIARKCIARNEDRDRSPLNDVPSVAIRGTINRLERPSFDEGFDRLFYVKISNSEFLIEDWKDEV